MSHKLKQRSSNKREAAVESPALPSTTTPHARAAASTTRTPSKPSRTTTTPSAPKYTNAFKVVRLTGVYNAVAVVLILLAHFWFLYYLYEAFNKIEDKPNVPNITNYVDLWVPVFLVSMLAELAWVVYKKFNIYNTADSLCNMGTGGLTIITRRLWTMYIPLFPYMYVWKHYALTREFAEGGAFAWWVMFIGIEFGYYWAHRTGHTINAFWAMHGVHHSSEEYNLSVALRQSTFHGMFGWVFYLPLALFFPPSLYMIHSQYNLLYQYWIHTPVINRCGPLEYIINTPAQHRVHHGKNEYCIDKNYGGTLCIFDRLFGTFQDEIEEIPIVYGTVHPINTFNSIEANIHPWRGIWAAMGQVDGLWNKILILYRGPGWIPGSNPPEEYPIPAASTDSITKYRPQMSISLQAYLLVQYVVLILGLTIGLELVKASTTWTLTLSSMLFWTYQNFGLISDRRPLAVVSEIMRLFTIAVLGLIALHSDGDIFATLADTRSLLSWAFAIGSVAWLLTESKALARPLLKSELGDTNYEQAEKHQQAQYKLAGIAAK